MPLVSPGYPFGATKHFFISGLRQGSSPCCLVVSNSQTTRLSIWIIIPNIVNLCEPHRAFLDSLAAFAAENQDFPVTSGDPKKRQLLTSKWRSTMEKAKKTLT